jgi:multidrug efflux pump subunit AcrB
VFTSVIFLEGPAKYLFTPLGLAVAFAMLASYGLSRTLTPITIGLLLKGEHRGAEGGWFGRFHRRLERGFDRLRDAYAELLTILLTRRIIVPFVAMAILALGTVMYLFVGRDFFPAIDGGQIQLHVRAPAGTRIEKTEQIFEAVENKIRQIVPASERELIVDNIGLPARLYNLAFADGSTIGINDGVILARLRRFDPPFSAFHRASD